MQKYLLCALAFAFLIFVSGCVQNPNNNLYYADCCMQNADAGHYVCQARADSSGNFITDSNGYIILDNCGQCSLWDRSAGAVYGSDVAAGPLEDANGNFLSPSECDNNCNFQRADCTNADGQNTCYGTGKDGNQVAIAPICVDATPNPCVQNDCGAMVCYTNSPSYKLTADSQGLQSQAQPGSAASLDYADAGQGLYAKACTFMQMDTKAANILKKDGSFVNSFRLGIQGTFSDYDRARYYFPPNDFYCGNAQANSVVDRFTAYLDANGNAPAKYSGNYEGYVSNYLCDEGQDSFGATSYSCKPSVNPDLANIKFSEATYGSKDAALAACAKLCATANLPACTDNQPLITQDAAVSPPGSQNEVEAPFVDIGQYYKGLDGAYPLESSADYYHTLPDIKYIQGQGATPEQIKQAQDEYLKPGPGGGRAFECLTNEDCLSADCDKGAFSRSGCINGNGDTVACGCQVIDNCGAAYLCSSYEAGSREQVQCQADKMHCEWTEKPVLSCDYGVANNAFVEVGGQQVDTGKIDKFGGYPDTDSTPIEMSVKQVLDYKMMCYNKGLNPQSQWKDTVDKCPAGYNVNPNARGRADGCIDVNGIPAPMGTGCDFGYALTRYYSWRDDTSGIEDGIEQNWAESMSAVPDKQSVWAGQWGGIGAYIITNRDVTFADLQNKMPLISACNMQDGVDLVKLGTAPYEGTKEQATKMPDIIYDSGTGQYWRWDATWQIKGLGDCQIGSNGIPKVLTYGVCKPCGSVLSYAYQNVSDWAPSDSSKPYGYCPNDCFSNGGYCQCPQDANGFIPSLPGSPSTDPDFSFLASKIDEYQSANIIPILDIRDYSIAASGNGVSRKIDLRGLSQDKCGQLGGSYTPEICLVQTLWWCVEHDPSHCEVNGAQQNDYFLSYLENNRSAVILEVANLPDDCADKEADPGAQDGPKCTDAIGRITSASLLCPDCMLAVEYTPTIGALSSGTYPDDLKKAITDFSGAGGGGSYNPIIYNEEKFGPQWAAKIQIPPQIAKVSMLILNVNLGGISSDPQQMKEQLNYTINISRRVLQHVGYTTLYKLQIPKSSAASQENGNYMLESLYHAINSMQPQMAKAGIAGMLLPPLDNGDTDASQYSEEQNGRLMDTSADTINDVAGSGLPFCKAELGSTTFLHPDVTVALQKAISQGHCECKPCSALEIQSGACGTGSALCLDGNPCENYDKNSNTYADAAPNDLLKCQPSCFRADRAQACADSNQQVTCRKIESSNSPPTLCNSPVDLETGCGIIAFSLPQLQADAYFAPYQAELIAGLPEGKKCYVEDGAQKAMYDSLLTTKTSSQPLAYSIYGSTTTDCGSPAFTDEEITSCQQSKVPLPIRKSAWVCS
ncbi:MAG: hypothetical protein V1822_03690 [Candidatus Micrarchaeota archaeon]